MKSPKNLSLMQWNVGNFDVRLRPLGNGPRGMHYTYATASRDEDLKDMAAVIRAESPDIVTLQEVVIKTGHHETLAQLAGYKVAIAGNPKDRHTQVVLVRPGTQCEPGPAPEGFNGVAARLTLEDGRRLVAVSTHSQAGKFTSERADQHKALAAWTKKISSDMPVVVAGDFNFDDGRGGLHEFIYRLKRWIPFLPDLASADWGEDCAGLEALRADLQDFGETAGPTAGAPRKWQHILLPWGFMFLPVAWMIGIGWRRSRLDYIWGSTGLSGAQARVIRLTGPKALRHTALTGKPFPWMDHDPVLARFALRSN